MDSGVSIITIGDEILIGQIVDTNSAWMAVELNKAGFKVQKIISIHDDESQILATLDAVLDESEIVLITGGLGPTKDDITKLALCRYFDTRLVYDESVYQNIESLFKHRPSVMNELTKQQAMVPENCLVIQNRVGTAPAMWFERNKKVVVSMPGVPFEMKTVMKQEIIPRLRNNFEVENILHKTVQVYGYGESALALKIAAWENSLPEFLHLAYLPSLGIVKLRLSGSHPDKNLLENEVTGQFESLKSLLGGSVVAENDLPIEITLSEILRENKLTISTAESCTGGNIAHRITLIPGSSEIFKGSIVAYDDRVKTEILQVSQNDLNNYGAVSRQVVEQMAVGVRKLMKTDLAVATSGIAGPSGGTEEKPVGMVWIAACSQNQVISRLFHLGNSERGNIIERSSLSALLMLKELL